MSTRNHRRLSPPDSPFSLTKAVHQHSPARLGSAPQKGVRGREVLANVAALSVEDVDDLCVGRLFCTKVVAAQACNWLAAHVCEDEK